MEKKATSIAKFDTTEQEFKLREAQADLAEAEQQVVQAEAESDAKAEEARYELVKAKSDLKLAQLEAQRNELLSRIAARQNDLAVSSAEDRVKQLESDYEDRLGAARAGIAMQQAARTKAKVASETAQRNIDSMTLKAKTSGYVAVQQNTQGNFNWGSYFRQSRSGITSAQVWPLRKFPTFAIGRSLRASVNSIADTSPWDYKQISKLSHFPEESSKGKYRTLADNRTTLEPRLRMQNRGSRSSPGTTSWYERTFDRDH